MLGLSLGLCIGNLYGSNERGRQDLQVKRIF